MTILEDIAHEIVKVDSLFNSALAEWVLENAVDIQNDMLYMLLRYDDTTRAEIAKEAVEYCGKYVHSKTNWLRHIATNSLLLNRLKCMFEGLKLLCEVPVDGAGLPSPEAAWLQWKSMSSQMSTNVNDNFNGT